MPSNKEIGIMQKMLDDYIRTGYGRGQDFWNKGEFFADRAADMETKRGAMIDPIYNEILFPGMQDYLAMLQDPLEMTKLADTTGLSPQAIAALKGNAIEQNAAQFATARGRLKEMMGKRGFIGGQSGTSGIYANMLTPLLEAEARARAGGLRDVILADEQARQGNWQFANEFNLSNRAQDLGGYGNLISGATNGIGTLGGIFSPDPYLNAATNMYGLNTDMMRNVLGGMNERGQHLKSSWFEKYGMPLIGAASGAAMNAFLPGSSMGGLNLSSLAPNVPATGSGMIPFDFSSYTPKVTGKGF